MKRITLFVALVISLMSSANTFAESVSVKSPISVPEAVEVAKSDTRTMVKTNENGYTYKYEFVLDTEGRVINRVTSTWDNKKSAWKPLSAFAVIYTDDETIVNYAKYNPRSKKYSVDVQQKRYNAIDYPYIFTVPECCK